MIGCGSLGIKKERLLSALTGSVQVISWYHFLHIRCEPGS